jgi:signal transduction histidine kinase
MVSKITTIKRMAFVAVFVLTVGASLATGLWAHDLVEPANIILFVPLFWAFLSLRPGGMIVSGVVVAAARIAVETLRTWKWGPLHAVELPGALNVSFMPILLYVVLGIVLYSYRRRQAVLTADLVEASTFEARNRISSSLAHDFNNILAVIIGTTELLLRDRTHGGQLRKDLETIRSAGEQGMSLVQQMRQASRGPSEGPTPQDLAELTERQMALVERVLPPNVHVVRHSSGPLPVRVDKAQMLRVLMNLCLNAKEAMPDGGVLTVRTGRREIGGTPLAELAVSDTGLGIDPSLFERIFEPFFTTHSSSGAGLGLSIVRSIASAHDGKVEVRNVPGAGAEFSFLVPMDTSWSAVLVPKAPAEKSARSAQRPGAP